MTNIAVIYDLDETILPTSSIPEATFQPVFDAITIASNGTLTPEVLAGAFAELWRKPIDIVAKAYHFSDAMIEAGRDALINGDYHLTLSPFDDFDVVKQIAGKRILVTTGITKLQQAKIDALFNADDFDEVIIDDPYMDDRLGKQKIFAQVAQRHGLCPQQVWVVGDNPESEIAAGNALGMQTVQITRPGISASNQANYVITSFYQLKVLIEAAGF